MWDVCHTKKGGFRFHEGKGFQWLDILEIFVSWQLKVQEHFSAFPCLSLSCYLAFQYKNSSLFPCYLFSSLPSAIVYLSFFSP